MDPVPPERTAYLGRYDEFEADLVLDILRDAGIWAATKEGLTESEGGVYPFLHDRGVVLVDASRLEDARTIVEAELPRHVDAIAATMDEAQTDEEEPET